jgi:hypothetical protein
MCKYLCPLGKQQIEASFSARGEACSARSRLNLNLRTWSKMFVSFNLAMGQVVGKLLGWFAGSGLGLKRKGFHLGRFLPRLKTKVTQ